MRTKIIDFFNSIKTKYMVLTKKKKLLIWCAISAVCIGLLVAIIGFKTLHRAGSTYVAEKLILDASIKEENKTVRYLIEEDTNGNYVLYKDGLRIKNIQSNETERVCAFDYNATTASDALLDNEDNTTENETGANVYRSTKDVAERYIAYLKHNGYEITSYIMSTSVWDGFLRDGNDNLYRFLYIKSSDNNGTVIFSEMDEDTVEPTDIEMIIDEYLR